ncbi:IclR family transcriptional regulator [Martelella soudanensis]|uniref:IclR family transcriptional regulator n=1 Tax=unclassified Martelella TaxID=2629616 RepID=UPI0015DDD050|nr:MULTISPECIES: IclR family transcriptional regulator [unclassified Martelella]
MEQSVEPAAQKHTVPVIDRMMEVLGLLERRPDGMTIRDLSKALDQPRTTVYRILNTLQVHQVVRRDDDGFYYLGARLLQLAAQVAGSSGQVDIAALSQPVLDQLADEIGESCKLSVLDDKGLLVIAVSQGRRDYALSVTPGQRMPAHVGAAGKLLLSHLDGAELESRLAKPLVAMTAKSVTDPQRLRRELVRIRKQGYGHDAGEHMASIQAVSAPVYDRAGKMLAAISVPFLRGTEQERIDEIREAVIKAAKGLTAALKAQAIP